MVGRDCSTSRGHRCHVHSGVSLCNWSVKSSLNWSWTMSVRPCRSSTHSVVPSDLNFSNTGARVAGGGPCKRGGASISIAFLNQDGPFTPHHLSSSEAVRWTSYFLFKGSLSRLRSTQSLGTSVNAGSCCSRHAFPRFTAPHAMADLAMAVVNVPSVGTNLCDAMSVLGKSVGPSIWFRGLPGTLSSLGHCGHLMRRSRVPHKQLHFGPGKSRDGLERLFSTSIKLHSPLVLEVPAKHQQYLPREAEVFRPGPSHWEADPLESLRQMQDQSYCTLIVFLPPNLSISNRISHTVR